jgi:pSer/pThr/pTyr-binding forkhead associated (FHA) protein
LVIGGDSITIGRAADAGLVLDDPEVSDHHARVTRTLGGGFAILDLASTTGTFLGANRIGVALLRSGDLLRFGPSAQLRFAIVNSIEESP